MANVSTGVLYDPTAYNKVVGSFLQPNFCKDNPLSRVFHKVNKLDYGSPFNENLDNVCMRAKRSVGSNFLRMITPSHGWKSRFSLGRRAVNNLIGARRFIQTKIVDGTNDDVDTPHTHTENCCPSKNEAPSETLNRFTNSRDLSKNQSKSHTAADKSVRPSLWSRKSPASKAHAERTKQFEMFETVRIQTEKKAKSLGTKLGLLKGALESTENLRDNHIHETLKEFKNSLRKEFGVIIQFECELNKAKDINSTQEILEDLKQKLIEGFKQNHKFNLEIVNSSFSYMEAITYQYKSELTPGTDFDDKDKTLHVIMVKNDTNGQLEQRYALPPKRKANANESNRISWKEYVDKRAEFVLGVAVKRNLTSSFEEAMGKWDDDIFRTGGFDINVGDRTGGISGANPDEPARAMAQFVALQVAFAKKNPNDPFEHGRKFLQGPCGTLQNYAWLMGGPIMSVEDVTLKTAQISGHAGDHNANRDLQGNPMTRTYMRVKAGSFHHQVLEKEIVRLNKSIEGRAELDKRKENGELPIYAKDGSGDLITSTDCVHTQAMIYFDGIEEVMTHNLRLLTGNNKLQVHVDGLACLEGGTDRPYEDRTVRGMTSDSDGMVHVQIPQTDKNGNPITKTREQRIIEAISISETDDDGRQILKALFTQGHDDARKENHAGAQTAPDNSNVPQEPHDTERGLDWPLNAVERHVAALNDWKNSAKIQGEAVEDKFKFSADLLVISDDKKRFSPQSFECREILQKIEKQILNQSEDKMFAFRYEHNENRDHLGTADLDQTGGHNTLNASERDQLWHDQFSGNISENRRNSLSSDEQQPAESTQLKAAFKDKDGKDFKKSLQLILFDKLDNQLYELKNKNSELSPDQIKESVQLEINNHVEFLEKIQNVLLADKSKDFLNKLGFNVYTHFNTIKFLEECLGNHTFSIINVLKSIDQNKIVDNVAGKFEVPQSEAMSKNEAEKRKLEQEEKNLTNQIAQQGAAGKISPESVKELNAVIENKKVQEKEEQALTRLSQHYINFDDGLKTIFDNLSKAIDKDIDENSKLQFDSKKLSTLQDPNLELSSLKEIIKEINDKQEKVERKADLFFYGMKKAENGIDWEVNKNWYENTGVEAGWVETHANVILKLLRPIENNPDTAANIRKDKLEKIITELTKKNLEASLDDVQDQVVQALLKLCKGLLKASNENSISIASDAEINEWMNKEFENYYSDSPQVGYEKPLYDQIATKDRLDSIRFKCFEDQLNELRDQIKPSVEIKLNAEQTKEALNKIDSFQVRTPRKKGVFSRNANHAIDIPKGWPAMAGFATPLSTSLVAIGAGLAKVSPTAEVSLSAVADVAGLASGGVFAFFGLRTMRTSFTTHRRVSEIISQKSELKTQKRDLLEKSINGAVRAQLRTEIEGLENDLDRLSREKKDNGWDGAIGSLYTAVGSLGIVASSINTMALAGVTTSAISAIPGLSIAASVPVLLISAISMIRSDIKAERNSIDRVVLKEQRVDKNGNQVVMTKFINSQYRLNFNGKLVDKKGNEVDISKLEHPLAKSAFLNKNNCLSIWQEIKNREGEVEGGRVVQIDANGRRVNSKGELIELINGQEKILEDENNKPLLGQGIEVRNTFWPSLRSRDNAILQRVTEQTEAHKEAIKEWRNLALATAGIIAGSAILLGLGVSSFGAVPAGIVLLPLMVYSARKIYQLFAHTGPRVAASNAHQNLDGLNYSPAILNSLADSHPMSNEFSKLNRGQPDKSNEKLLAFAQAITENEKIQSLEKVKSEILHGNFQGYFHGAAQKVNPYNPSNVRNDWFKNVDSTNQKIAKFIRANRNLERGRKEAMQFMVQSAMRDLNLNPMYAKTLSQEIKLKSQLIEDCFENLTIEELNELNDMLPSDVKYNHAVSLEHKSSILYYSSEYIEKTKQELTEHLLHPLIAARDRARDRATAAAELMTRLKELEAESECGARLPEGTFNEICLQYLVQSRFITQVFTRNELRAQEKKYDNCPFDIVTYQGTHIKTVDVKDISKKWEDWKKTYAAWFNDHKVKGFDLLIDDLVYVQGQHVSMEMAGLLERESQARRVDTKANDAFLKKHESSQVLKSEDMVAIPNPFHRFQGSVTRIFA